MISVVVLGGTGFLGRHVMRLLEDRKIPAVSLSRTTGCDLLDRNRIIDRLAAEHPSAILNCAAHVGSVHYVSEHAADVIHDNMQMILNAYAAVCSACPGALVVNPISNCSYPGAAEVHSEPAWQDGPVHDSVLAYGMPRRMIHAVARAYRKQHGIRSVNWLVANAYGPGDHLDPNRVHALNGIVIRLIGAQRAGAGAFTIWGSGKPVREWVYIEDVARVLVDSLSIDEQIDPLNLAQNRAYSIAEIASLVARRLEYEVRFEFDTSYADGAPTKILDDRMFRSHHPEFRFTPFEEGIERTIQYYRSALVATGGAA